MKLQGRNLSNGTQGDDVRLLHQELFLLGFQQIPKRETVPGVFGPETQAAVRAFQKDAGLEVTGIVDEKTARAINERVDALQPEGGEEEGASFLVRGRVTHPDGQPLANVKVLAFDRDLRREQWLGEAATDNAGRYEIRYLAEQFRRAEKRSADLVVRAFSPTGNELAASATIFNAGKEETVDLVVGGGAYLGPSEFEQLVTVLTPLLDGLAFADLTEDDQHQDVTFLSGESGQDSGRITFLIAAHRLREATNIDAEIFYGMSREGLPTRLPALMAQSPEVRRRAVVRAANANVIPPRFGEQADAIVERFKALVVTQAMKPPAEGESGATISGLLAMALPSPELTQSFLTAYVNHTGPVETFWQELSERPDLKDHVEEVQRTLQLGALAGNHLPLVEELQRMRRYGEISELSDLARLDEQGWLEILSKDRGKGPIGAPTGMPGKDEAEKTRHYAKAISHLVEDTFPTSFVAHRLEASDLPGKEDLRTFLSANAHFDLRSTRLTNFLQDNPGALAGVHDPETATARVRALQRVYRLAPRWEQAKALLADGVDSAHAVTLVGENVFVAKYGEAVGGKTAARRIHDKAHQVKDTSLLLSLEFGLPSPRVSTQVVPDAAVAEVGGIPDWSTLFGSLELCGCEHCRSVYSPAAYFVDILHFLKGRPSKVPGKSAKDILFLRRPDLGEIELTCENTNTPLPYVDLVNEALENAVAPFDEAARSRQTQGSAAERAANPQYVNDAAYQVLGRAVYPWSLPFDLGAEEVRAYLGHLGVSRFQIIEALQPGDRAAVLEDTALAHEHLGLTRAQARLITGPATGSAGAAAKPWRHWGFATRSLTQRYWIPDPSNNQDRIATGNWLEVLSGRVDVFLQQSGMTYAEMLKLLGTYFVNPTVGDGRAIHIKSTDSDHPDICETAKLRLAGFDLEAAARTVRFVRLARALGWSLRDLDRAVTAFRPTSLSSAFLTHLSHVERLRAALDVPVPRLLSWWSDLDTAFYIDHAAPGQPRAASLYDQLFRNHASINPPDPAFTENAVGLTGTLTEHASTIKAALGLNAVDFALLLALLDDTLSLQDLSCLHRHASLARALRLSVREYLTALKLIAVNPFASTTATVTFVETVEKSRDSGFTFAELDYVLRHVSSPESSLVPSDDAIATLLDELRAGVQKIAEENTFRADRADPAAPTSSLDDQPTTDLDGELTRRKLALLNWERGLIDQAVATLSGTEIYETRLDALPEGLSLPNAPGVWAVDLPAPPTGFVIPSQLRGVVAYDSAGQRLTAARTLSAAERELLWTAADATGDDLLIEAVYTLLREQNALRGTISYDATRKVLRFSGPMTSIRRQRLQETWTNPDDYSALYALLDLYDAPRRFIRRGMRGFAVQDFTAELKALPDGFKIPIALKRKVYFDPSAERLHCLGVLSEPERDALLALSTDADAAYQAAINSLYEQAETLTLDPLDSFLTAEDAALLFDEPMAPADRFSFALAKLLPYLSRTLSERLAVQTMAEALQLETRSTDVLLRSLASPANPMRRCLAELLDPTFAESSLNVQPTPTTFLAQFKTFLRLHKAAMITARLKLSHRQIGWLFAYGPGAGWLDLGALPTAPEEDPAAFDRWLRLVELARLRDALPQGEKALDALLALAHTPGAAKDAWLTAVTHWTLWPAADLKTLLGPPNDPLRDPLQAGQLAAAFPADYAGERLLLRLCEIFRLLGRLGMPVSQAVSLASGDVTAEEARGVRQIVRAKYDEAQWLILAKPLRDVLRERQRAALVAYLVSHLRLPRNVRDANDLYAHFLIDVEMAPCMMTSRIKQAISSVQLFVQRCLMNLEPDVEANAEEDGTWREWKWMKNYRVWEANRKVFLYPENWIEPELRDDKSPFFTELESELLQSDLTRETAEDALLHYLEKLDEVAHLEVVGIHHQLEPEDATNAAVDILHVFARTPATPHVYYYRRRIDSAAWTAWERVDLDIEGEHLIPMVWNRRLYLFWPIFTEKADPPPTPDFTGGSPSGIEPQRYWEIRLAWSERKQSKWTTKRISSQFIREDFHLRYMDDPAGFFFRIFIDAENNLHVLVLHLGVLLRVAFGGTTEFFRFDGCHAEPAITPAWGNWRYLLKLVTGTVFDRMFYHEDGDRMLFLPAPRDTAALAKTPGIFLLLPYADGNRIAEHPFFYRDDKRTFLIIPSDEIPPMMLNWSDALTMDPAHIPDLSKHYLEAAVSLSDTIGPGISPEDSAIREPTFPSRPGFDESRPNLTVVDISPEDLLAHSDAIGRDLNLPRTEKRFCFKTFYHPYVCTFVRELNRNGVDGLLQRQVQQNPQRFAPGLPPSPPFDFKKEYEPLPVVIGEYPTEEVSFDEDDAYALYNWELFFHAPLMIADRLSKNQRYEEAQSWFHYIFDPTDTSSEPSPQRYWQTKPFFEHTQKDYRSENIEHILRLLAAGGSPRERARLGHWDRMELERFEKTVAAWRKDPFKPHLIARMRTTAYQKTVVMKYLDNLIAWADQLFRRDTLESINEATQLYVLAAEILGRRPEAIPPRATPPVETYNSLEPKLDAFSNSLVQMEDFIPPSAGGGASARARQGPPLTLPGILFFCVPKNDKLLTYWDTVADRLFKIRHCMNIEGIVRQLPLFEPPIDPALLVKAAAAGVDLGSVLNDVSAAPPHYRFNVLAQKASELCSELKSLGQALLSTLEKRDAEHLSLLRSQHETALLALVEQVRKLQVDEAVKTKDALSKSRDSAVTRYVHYQKLLGVQDPQVPGIGDAIPEGSPSPHVTIQEEGGVKVIPFERAELNKLREANDWQQVSTGFDSAAGVAHILPNFAIKPWWVGASFGGSNIGSALSASASLFRSYATQASYEAGRSARLGQYALRAHDWLLQSDLAGREIMQIDQQTLAADLRKQIAERELANHQRQIENTREVEEFLRDKYTNQELYGWMLGQLATVYFQTYQLAYDLAKRAERAFRHELSLKDSSFIQFGYWDSLKKGLLAGERLFHDLKRMEVAYLDQNRREYEITRHVSLTQLDPLALMQLRQTGTCIVGVPEALFDLDFPGHYMRRLKSVSMSVPCVTGPYSGVPCTLTLLRSSVRHASTLVGGTKYARQEGDPRFSDSVGAIESIVTSSGQNDSGLFETNLRDERFLPFEGAGAIGDWQIELPAVFRPFDYNTISDVVLHLRYTAREGGGLLKQQAVKELKTALDQFHRSEGRQGLARVFSLRHEFPSAFHRLLHSPVETPVEIVIDQRFLPYFLQGRDLTVETPELRLHTAAGLTSDASFTIVQAGYKVTLTVVDAGNLAPPSGETPTLDPDKLLDLILYVEYEVEAGT